MKDGLEIKYIDIKDLKPYERNARTHSKAQIEQIAASMREFGFTNPVLIDPDQGIIAGHGRLAAAQLIGMKEVPAITLHDLTPDQRRALVIADNRLALDAGWDMETLGLEIKALQDANFDIDVLGFDGSEIDEILGRSRSVGATDEDDVPEAPEVPVSRVGDVWLLGGHRIICGDSTSPETVGKLLDGIKPTLMVTDPPYGVEYDPEWRAEAGVNKNKAKMGKVENDDRADWSAAWALFPGDIVYMWHAGKFAADCQKALESADFEVRCQIIWAKDRFALSRGNYHWQHEPCWYAVRKKAKAEWRGGRNQSTLWNIKSRDDDGHGHGTQKPVECMRRPIENNTSPGQAVYDPFVGSGTTIIAAETVNRVCLAVEINPAYVDVAIRRWQEFTKKQAILAGTKTTFEQMLKERNKPQKAAANG